MVWGGQRRGWAVGFLKPQLQHQERPQPLVVVAPAGLMLFEQVADKGFAGDASSQEAG